MLTLQAALQECLQHMRQYHWQPSLPAASEPLFSAPLCDTNQRSEARDVAQASVYQESAAASQQQHRRSARLLGHGAAEPSDSTPSAVIPIANISSSELCADMVTGDDLVSAGSLASSQSTFIEVPGKGL